MIVGSISAANEAVIPVTIRAADGQTSDSNAIIDTGFSGYLTLDPADIAALQLPFRQRNTYELGDGRQVDFNTYRAIVLWNGQERVVSVLESDGGTLVGMELMHGHTLFLDIIDGGEVRMEARS